MKFSIKKADLLFALDTAVGIIEARNTVPILGNVKINADGNALHVTATDMDMQAECETPIVALSAAGQTTVPAKTLRNIVNKANADIIDVSTNDTAIHITAGTSKFKLGTLPPEDFPLLNFAVGTAIQFSMPAASLKRILERTRHAMSNEETRYYLCGVFLHASPVGNNLLRGVATDGHTLALADDTLSADTDSDVHDNIPALILPRKAVETLHGLLGTLESNVHITMADNGITFVLGNMVTLKTKVIDGTFPDYTRVMPTNNPILSIINNPATSHAIGRVATICTDKSRAVKLEFGTDSTIKISASGSDGQAAEDVVDASTNENIAIGFNSYLLQNALKQLPETVHMKMGDPASPVLLIDPDDTTHQYVVMPMRV